jgi:hypothetical protein
MLMQIKTSAARLSNYTDMKWPEMEDPQQIIGRIKHRHGFKNTRRTPSPSFLRIQQVPGPPIPRYFKLVPSPRVLRPRGDRVQEEPVLTVNLSNPPKL